MHREERDLKVVILNSFYDAASDPLVQTLFSKIGALKISGYLGGNQQECYPYGTLPFDGCDVIGTHILICDASNHQLEPLVGFKSVSMNRLSQFRLPFPSLGLAKENGSQECFIEMQKILASYPGKVSWDSSWTLKPEIRKDHPKLQLLLLQLTAMLLVQFHQDYSECPYWLTCGIPRVGSDKFFMRMGLEKVSHNPEFSHPQLSHEKAVMLFLKHYSDYAWKLTEKHLSLWNQKLVIPDRQVHQFIRSEIRSRSDASL